MAMATNMVTFMVRVPATTRSVSLYGSWDNFSIPVPMSRDISLGVEHWSGCHNFENIVCDGNFGTTAPTRSGGLKTGGTYWYFYKLDGDIEFHNSSEPSTTRCPMLQGQLVNELHVPLTTSRSHKRKSRTSSINSEVQTLDLGAEHVNLEIGSTQPKVGRINTSPTRTQQCPPGHSILAPMSAAPMMQTDLRSEVRAETSRIFHLPRKPSLDALLKIGSAKKPTPRLRSAIQLADSHLRARQDEKYQNIIDWIPDRPTDAPAQRMNRRVPPPLPERPQARPHRGSLLLRSNSDETITLTSFGEHRRQKSRSRSRNGSERNSMVFDESSHLDLTGNRVVEPAVLSVLIEVQSPGSTPGYGPQTGRRITLEALEGRSEETKIDEPRVWEKRLPTLPNTPSSAYPQSMHASSPPPPLPPRAQHVDSHFSATTIDTSSHLDSILMDAEQQRRLLSLTDVKSWSSCSGSIIDSRACSLTIAESETSTVFRPMDLNTSALSQCSESDEPDHERGSSSTTSCTTISSPASTTPRTTHGDGDCASHGRLSYVTTIRSSGGSINFQHCGLPEIENASEVTLAHFKSSDCATMYNNKNRASRHRSDMSHSEGMRQLLDELSYLSELIQQ